MPDIKQRTLNILTMAKKAGKITFGFDCVKEEMLSKKALCVFITSDISGKTFKEISFYSEKYGIPYQSLDITMNDTEYCLGKRAGILSISDKGFSDSLKKLYV